MRLAGSPQLRAPFARLVTCFRRPSPLRCTHFVHTLTRRDWARYLRRMPALPQRLTIALATACLLTAPVRARAQGYQFADMAWGISPDSALRQLRSHGYRLVERIPGVMAVRGTTSGHRVMAMAEFSDSGLARVFVVMGKGTPALLGSVVRSLDEKYGEHDDTFGEAIVRWRIRVPIGGYTLTAALNNGAVELLYECPGTSRLADRPAESAAAKRLRQRLTRDF